MNENDFTRQLHSDSRLRKAVSRREQQLPPMPAGLNDQLILRIGQQERKPRRVWPYAAIAAAASVLILLSLQYIYNNVEPRQQPMVAQQTEQPGNTMITEVALSQTTIRQIDKSTRRQKDKTTKQQNNQIAKRPDTQATEDLAACIARLEAEMEALDDSVREAHLEKIIAADARLQQLVYSIVGKQTEQAINKTLNDSTANYINF